MPPVPPLFPTPTKIVVIGSVANVNVSVIVGGGQVYSDIVQAIVRGGGVWSGGTFILLSQITSITAQ